jgi:hypothetical protein
MEVHPHEPLKQARTLINSLTLTWDALLDRNAKFLLILIFKNGSVGDKTFSSKEEIFPKNPLALF